MSLPNIQSFDNLGGELADYSPVTDPTTDLSAESSNEMRSDVAAMTRTAIKAYVAFTTDGGDVFVASGDYDAVYGNAEIYKPTGVVSDVGKYTITFPSSIVDSRGITQSLNLKMAWCNFETIGNFALEAKARVTSANTVEVILYDYSGPNISDPPDPTTDRIILFVI
jgi:hypothetical protein